LAPRAKTGASSALWIGDGGSLEEFTKLSIIQTLKRQPKKQADEKVTNMDSPMDANGVIYQELIGTIADPGTWEITLFWDPEDPQHQLMMARLDNHVHNYQVRGPNNLGSSPLTRKFTERFAAQMFESPSYDLTVDKAMTLTIKLQIIGEPEDVTYDDPADGN
jgi:hypothetical protein